MIESTASITKTKSSVAERLTQSIRSCDYFPSHVECPLEINAIDWAKAQAERTKLLWSNRCEDKVVTTSGVAAKVIAESVESASEVFARCRQVLADNQEIKFYGGFSFRQDDYKSDDQWRPFARTQFWLPRLVCDGRTIACTVLSQEDKDDAIAAVNRMTLHSREASFLKVTYSKRCDLPTQSVWNETINEAIGLFEKEVLEKIVLARCTQFHFSKAIDPFDLIDRLTSATYDCYDFCFQIKPGLSFLGATPERLFHRSGVRLQSEVVAGTRRRGSNAEEDMRLSSELLHSAKDQLEHDIVRKSIRQRLHQLVDALEVDANASILKLAKKQHLYSGVRATLKESVSDGQLLDRLHPTPAVGGYPIENAMSEIARLEPFDRGWYAAPIGWISRDEAEFAVAIRSGLLHDRQLSLYSGAGIVPGSTAENEWEEIENKISDFLEVIS